MSVTRHLLATVDQQPVRISLSWDSRSPFAVRMDIHLRDGKTVPWEFAGDLLAAGMLAPAGLGDVQIRPDRWRPDRTLIVLRVGPELARLSVATADVEAFLGEMWVAEPPPVTDAELAELIDRWATDGVS